MLNTIEIIKDRFDKLWDLIKSSGFTSTVHPEESKIRLEEVITDGQSVYTFDLKKDKSLLSKVERSLDRNDVFVPNRMGFLLALVNNTTGVETLYSYAPVADGTAASVHKVGFLTDAIRKIYGGSWSWNVDTNVMISAYPMEKCEWIPQVQGATLLKSDDTAQILDIQSEFDIEKALPLLIPRYTIAGTRDHKIQVQFEAAGLQFPFTPGYTAKLCLMMDGFLVKGGCEYKGGSGTNPFGDAVGQW